MKKAKKINKNIIGKEKQRKYCLGESSGKREKSIFNTQKGTILCICTILFHHLLAHLHNKLTFHEEHKFTNI